MAIRYYDDALILKLKKWVPDNSNIRVLKPEETKRLWETTADDNKDQPFKLPIVALSRNTEIELLSTVKQPRSFDGLRLLSGNDETLLMNVIPIKPLYQLDIYTKTYEEGDEYLRNFLFKLINNPVIKIDIPYNSTNIQHIANIRVLSSASDTSDISERIFPGQFTRWTIQLEIQDAFLFSLPYKRNWKLDGVSLEYTDNFSTTGEIEDVVDGGWDIEWNTPTYTWNTNLSVCTAVRLSQTVPQQRQEEIAISKYVRDTEANYLVDPVVYEQGHMEASFHNPAFSTQATTAMSVTLIVNDPVIPNTNS